VSLQGLRPWTERVKLHPDVESGALTEAVFAIDLGAIAAGDPTVPIVNRDPVAFFQATYLTADLRKLLEEVLASLEGKSAYNRVLKLRTPFGGGKSHTLAALYHAARTSSALDVLPEARHFPRPREVAVAVFDGEKFDARDGKTLPDGRTIRTMWGWIAWQIDPERAFPLVAGHDQDRVAPGGDLIRELLTRGASGRPVLILLDEVLKYMERAAAVSVVDSTLQRQAKDFFQNLTVEVAGSERAALVYSLTWSAREALGNVGLLAEIDKLAARVDQLREPVAGDEVLYVLQRRLLGGLPDPQAVLEVATAYSQAVTNMRWAQAETTAERQQAQEEGLVMRDRMRAAYPFHPALIDIMRERWSAVDAFQRTRGALRFLASCLHSLKKHGGAAPLLGPGDVPLHDPEVRIKLLKELGAQNEYDPVITADIEGPAARAKRIDERLARETPALAHVRPASRLATAIFLYSFGGLRREAGGQGETLPPGVTENELLSACVGPELDNITATAVLAELRNHCLYLHYDGVRYCFKKDPNVTKLIEDAEQTIAREEMAAGGEGPVRERIREMLNGRLAGHHSAVVWPAKSQDIPDGEPRFLIAYLPLEFALKTRAEQEQLAQEYLTKYGDRPRRYRNGIGLAIPEKRQIEALRRAVRYLLAIERVENMKHQLRLSREQLDQLKERKRTEEAAAEACFRELYGAVWLLRVQEGELEVEKVERGGRPLRATGIQERLLELLTSAGTPRLHGSVTPRKVAERVGLGEGEAPVAGIRAAEVVESFFRDLMPPRLESEAAIHKAIARGVKEGVFGYVSGSAPALGSDGKFQVCRERVAFQKEIAEDEVDLESGFLIAPGAIPEAPGAGTAVATGPSTGTGVPPVPLGPGPDVAPPPPQAPPTLKTRIALAFEATREQIFKAFPAIANLADRSDGGKVKLRVEGTSAAGFDAAWLRNAVEEPLDEADIKVRREE